MTYAKAWNDLIFAVSPKGFCNTLADLLAEGDEKLLKDLYIDLHSRLIEWRLVNVLSREEIAAGAEKIAAVLSEADLAEAKKEIESIGSAKSAELCRRTDEGDFGFIWGHDLCTGYEWSFRRGARFITSNPAKINLFRKGYPERWGAIVKRVEEEHPGISAEEKVSWCWVLTVLEIAEAIRPIYEESKGKYGFVCIQPDPTKINEGDGEAIAKEIRFFEKAFRELMGTEDPNIAYKIPAVPCAREIIAPLKAEGLRLVMTLNFSVYQHDTFGDLIGGGLYGDFLVLMGGIVDDFVKNDLIAQGVDETAAVDISHYAATYILNRSYANNLGKKRIPLIMGGSARGAWSIEAVLCSDAKHPVALTSMADMVALYDEKGKTTEDVIRKPVDEDILATLLKSETFREAFEFDGLNEETLMTYPPLLKVSKSFIDAYYETLESLK